MNHHQPPIIPHIYRSFFDIMTKNEAAELLRYGKARQGCISLAQGEGSLPTPDFVCDAMSEALKSGKTFYGAALGLPELRQEIAIYMARIYGHNIPTNRISITTSGTNAVHFALLSILEAGDDVVAVTPIWKNLIGIAQLAGGTITEVPMTLNEGKWHLDLDKLFDACGSKTKAIMIVSPNNPTGWVMPAEDIKTILDYARGKGLWVIADEVYGRTTYNMSRAPSFLDYAEDYDQLYVINSFSKTWAMTGWRLGWLIGPRDCEGKINDLILYENMGPPPFIQIGAISALRHGEDFLAEQKNLWKDNLATLAHKWKNMERIDMAIPDSAFYAFFRVKGENNSYAFARRLIDEAGVSLAPGGAFGNGLNDYLRLCFAASPAVLDEALARLQPFLE